MLNLTQCAELALKDCLDLKKGEKFLVITDEPMKNIGEAFFKAGKELGAEAILMEIIPRNVNGEEPPEPVAKAWLEADVYVAPTSKSLTHTRARKNAVKNGARGATLPGATEEMLKRCLPVNYKEMQERSDILCKILTEGKHVRITTALGTDLSFSLETREGQPDTGIYNKSGESGNLPAGEAFIAPLEGTANGKLVVDGAMVGVVKNPITLIFKDGFAEEITGKEEADILNEMVNKVGKNARNCAEFGIGLNTAAEFTGNVLEDEKIFGTIHIAIGNNAHFGGKVDVPIHLDGIVSKPTVYIDGKVIIQDGKHLIY